MAFAAEEQEAVARELFGAPQGEWVTVTARCLSLGAWAAWEARSTDADGQQSGILRTLVGDEFVDLKEAMADEHGGWLTATCVVSRDGSYDFTFNYDSLEQLAWYDSTEIPDEAWEVDLIRFPRPWAEIPDWHLVKQKYTEKSWARQVAANT